MIKYIIYLFYWIKCNNFVMGNDGNVKINYDCGEIKTVINEYKNDIIKWYLNSKIQICHVEPNHQPQMNTINYISAYILEINYDKLVFYWLDSRTRIFVLYQNILIKEISKYVKRFCFNMKSKYFKYIFFNEVIAIQLGTKIYLILIIVVII